MPSVDLFSCRLIKTYVPGEKGARREDSYTYVPSAYESNCAVYQLILNCGSVERSGLRCRSPTVYVPSRTAATRQTAVPEITDFNPQVFINQTIVRL